MVVCYYLNFGAVEPTKDDRQICTNSQSSSDFFTCCNKAHVCLGNSLCYDPNKRNTGAAFYLASCSDPNYKDPNCPRYCGSDKTVFQQQNARYNESNQNWNCCGFGCKDDVPDGQSFVAPAPQLLLQGPTTSSSLPRPSTSNKGSGAYLSTGAAAAIGVGLAIMGLAIVAATGLIIWHRRQKHVQPELGESTKYFPEPRNELSSRSPAIDPSSDFEKFTKEHDFSRGSSFEKSTYLQPPNPTANPYSRAPPISELDGFHPVELESQAYYRSQSINPSVDETSSSQAGEGSFANIVSPISDPQPRGRLSLESYRTFVLYTWSSEDDKALK